MSAFASVKAEPSAEGAMLARVLCAIGQVANPLERAVYRGDLAELWAETPVERRPLALLMLLAAIERAQEDVSAPL